MDIRSVFDSDSTVADWRIAGGQLAMDDSMETAVMLSLFTEADAPAGIEIPDGLSPHRWWGQAYWPVLLASLGVTAPAGMQLGSLLWTLKRAKQTEETRSRAIQYARQSLLWMPSIGLVADVQIDGTWTAPGVLELPVTLVKPDGLPARFAPFWRLGQ
ncbi:putative Phage Protein gp46 [Magnetospirillum sp. XM-1]|uniref:phage GP46 family protein n=1 Tax=Magnetospirillum sp. XM-1 TaxID=1663591 RepID=UPI00073DC9E3|nr:phage GP46 family protein [Magnetospirillum sp. XM-1]CUW41148.1 putative Phage Protein gp46 [Magnetospirillum sp. XM-1]